MTHHLDLTTITLAHGAHPAMARFIAKVERHGDCWIWAGARDGEGYPSFRVDGRTVRGHRWFYAAVIGSVPFDLDLDHTCHNTDSSCPGGRRCLHRQCVNLNHLEPVSRAINLARSPHVQSLGEWHRAKTQCPAGHPYVGDNLHVKKSGARVCRACARERARRNYQTRKAG